MQKNVKKIIRFSVLLFMIVEIISCSPFSEKKMNTAEEVTKATMKAVVPPMIKTLFEHVEQVGYANSVEYCQGFAPAYGQAKTKELNTLFTEKYSTKNVAFKRVSLKLRNPKNQPTAQEAEVLKKWQEELNVGKKIQPKFFEKDGVYIGMMPMQIPSEKCLSCHGENLQEDVKARLKKLYPQDQAIGYQKKGDLRGAFVVYTEL